MNFKTVHVLYHRHHQLNGAAFINIITHLVYALICEEFINKHEEKIHAGVLSIDNGVSEGVRALSHKSGEGNAGLHHKLIQDLALINQVRYDD